MELEKAAPFAEFLQPLAEVLGALMLLSKAVAMMAFAFAGGEVSSGQSGAGQTVGTATDLQVAFYTAEDRFEPIETVEFQDMGADVYAPAISLKLAPIDSVGFADFTARHVGENITLEVCGQALFSPRLMTAIEGGELQLTGPDLITPLAGFMENGCR